MVRLAIGIAPVFAVSLALRHEVDVLQITTYYNLAYRPFSSACDGEKSAYREERRGRGGRDGFEACKMRHYRRAERLDSHFKELWGLFSPVI